MRVLFRSSSTPANSCAPLSSRARARLSPLVPCPRMRRTRAWRSMPGMKAPQDPTRQPDEAAPETRSQRADRCAQDRTRLEQGKTVTVREDPGGRRTHQTQKKEQKIE